MLDKIQQLKTQALQDLKTTKSETELKELERSVLGKKGTLKEILTGLKDASPEERRSTGSAANEAKKELEAAFKLRSKELERAAIEEALQEDQIDLSAPGPKQRRGHIHPLYQAQEEVERIFGQMGFSVLDGPEIESEYYNFEGLNIPKHHPARDMQDTFFIDQAEDPTEGRLVLRTQTSPGQIRSMKKYGVPLRMIIPGRTFRNEATDASHEHTFDQVEGLMIDEHISIAHLKGVMEEFLREFFKKDVKTRFRPGYFPFVEPGLELDMSCPFCGGDGCRTCKKTGWIEMMGCGMVHPHVLRAGGVDPEKYQGWAFGVGLTRVVMMRYGINDIRYLTKGDLRINQQF